MSQRASLPRLLPSTRRSRSAVELLGRAFVSVPAILTALSPGRVASTSSKTQRFGVRLPCSLTSSIKLAPELNLVRREIEADRVTRDKATRDNPPRPQVRPSSRTRREALRGRPPKAASASSAPASRARALSAIAAVPGAKAMVRRARQNLRAVLRVEHQLKVAELRVREADPAHWLWPGGRRAGGSLRRSACGRFSARAPSKSGSPVRCSSHPHAARSWTRQPWPFHRASARPRAARPKA